MEEESFRQYEQILNSWELIYPIPAGAFEDDFPFPKVGYVGSLEGSDQEGGGKRSAQVPFGSQQGIILSILETLKDAKCDETQFMDKKQPHSYIYI